MSENALVLNRTGVSVRKEDKRKVNGNNISQNRTSSGPSKATLLAECGLNFFLYLKSLNLSYENDMLVLPSNHHYYYEGEDVMNVRILVNLKKLNMIKHLDMFLNSLVRILPSNSSFIGCFYDGKPMEKSISMFSWHSRVSRRFYNFLDSRTDNILNKNKVSEILVRNGFKPLDMKEVNGLTYFCCKPSTTFFN